MIFGGSATVAPRLRAALAAPRAAHPDRLWVLSVVASPDWVRRYESDGFLVFEDPSRAVRAVPNAYTAETSVRKTPIKRVLFVCTILKTRVVKRCGTRWDVVRSAYAPGRHLVRAGEGRNGADRVEGNQSG